MSQNFMNFSIQMSVSWFFYLYGPMKYGSNGGVKELWAHICR